MRWYSSAGAGKGWPCHPGDGVTSAYLQGFPPTVCGEFSETAGRLTMQPHQVPLAAGTLLPVPYKAASDAAAAGTLLPVQYDATSDAAAAGTLLPVRYD